MLGPVEKRQHPPCQKLSTKQQVKEQAGIQVMELHCENGKPLNSSTKV